MTVDADPPGPPPGTRRRLLSHAGIYTAGTAAPAVASLLVLPLVTRLLSRPEYDVVALATVVVQVGVIVVALGIGAAITREYYLGGAGAAGARGLVFQSTALSVLVVAVGVAAGPVWAPALLGRPWSAALLLALVAAGGGAVVVVVQSFLRGAERPVAFVLLASGGTLVGPSAGLALLWSGQRTALAYVAALAGGYLLAAVAGLILTARSGRLDMSWRGLGGALRLGTPTVPHQVALYIALGGLVVVADRTLALGGTANVALTLGAGATVLTGAMNNAWAPLIYRTSPERRALVLTRTTRLIVVAVACLTGAVSLLSPYLLAVAAPPTYDHAAMVPTVAVASLAAVASVFYLASGHLILVHGRTGVLSITTPTSVAAGIALAVPLSGYLGLPAVGLAYAAIYAALALLTTLAQRRLVSERWMPPFTPVTLSTAVAAAALGALAPADGAWVAVRVVATGLLVMGTLLALRRQLGTRQS